MMTSMVIDAVVDFFQFNWETRSKTFFSFSNHFFYMMSVILEQILRLSPIPLPMMMRHEALSDCGMSVESVDVWAAMEE
jgi:hypothetical protein